MQLRARPAAAGLTFALALLAGAPARAQQDQLTIERIFSGEFRLQSLPDSRWMAGGQRYSYVTADGGVTSLVAEDAQTGNKTTLVDGRRLVPAGQTKPIDIEDYEWSADEKKLLIFTNSQPVWRQNTKGQFYVYDLASQRLTPASTAAGWQQFAKLSPDGSKVGFVRDNNLWVADLATGRETQLTRDGSETIINGTFDWVYEEELDLRDGWRWSPDGQRIAFWRIDDNPVKPFFWMRDTGDQYSAPISLRYPKAGAPNPTARLGVVEVASGRTTWLQTGDDSSVYLARMEWADSPTEIVVQRLNRHQNRLDVMMANAATGATRTLFTDADSAWVEVDDDLAFINGGRQFIFSSERDGYNHLYLYNRDGSVARQLTRGQWDVTQVFGVDEKNGWVYFSATEQGPQQRHLYRVRLDGTGFARLTKEPGTHGIQLSPETPYYLDTWSRAAAPPVITLHRTDGSVVRTLVENAGARQRLGALAIREPEFFTFRTSDGTQLNGSMIKPANFDPAKKYPVLMYVYGGPGSQTVTDAWGGSRYLWHQLLAQRGYIVVSVDNRGTGGRGSAFKKSTYLDLGTREAADQIEAARWLAQQPYVDPQRLGIWGWSYGGYMTAFTLEQPGSPFKAGISVAPVADWGLYDSIYTERFMRTPQENPEGYRRSSAVRNAAGLRARLLLIHGSGDDNVHFQNSVQLVDALQGAGKQFSFMMYPDRNHAIAGGRTIHLYTMMTDWITQNL
ncbi:S9 family peptidase [Longimicrobium sp.]|uniref:S9 family peptidase n=1 Tax=Longimicrobium sp. TaxID=2029185 RepID=UPI002B54DE46|nr:S9 family peptidase [Longimicrobium sp.]HSU16535.1 S9 family peptidase [Longimicrobium sp.]